MKPVQLVSAAIGEGAMDGGCKFGARVLRDTGIAAALTRAGRRVEVGPSVTANPLEARGKMQVIARFSQALADAVARAVQGGRQPLVLGGDHSCAIGTWSGAAQALAPHGRLGLIWVDAHLDAHTPDSSPSQAPHGMPVAALLGHGSPDLTGLFGWTGKIRPADLVLIGVRSYEPAERLLLETLGVRVLYMQEVARRGFEDCFAEAKAALAGRCAAWGVSIDVDGLDPKDAPATGTPVDRGIPLAQATAALTLCRNDPRFIALEIAEYNPLKDYQGKTAQAVHALAVASLGVQRGLGG